MPSLGPGADVGSMTETRWVATMWARLREGWRDPARVGRDAIVAVVGLPVAAVGLIYAVAVLYGGCCWR